MTMRVKRFGEFLNEKLFSGIIDRDMSGRIRKEDRIEAKSNRDLKKILRNEVERLRDGDRIINLNHIDVSGISDMSWVFRECGHFDELDVDVSEWDVRNVMNFNGLFSEMTKFTGTGLEKWDTENMVFLIGTFSGCRNFNADISGWKTDKLEETYAAFRNCSKFNIDLSGWNISGVKDLRNMFYGCVSFDQDLSGWNIYDGADMEDMFYDCTSMKKIPEWYKE